MKPERIQVGLAALPRWRMEARDDQAKDERLDELTRTFEVPEFWRALRILRQAAAMAQAKELRFDFELRGPKLTFRLPAGEPHLALARGIESLAGGPDSDTEPPG